MSLELLFKYAVFFSGWQPGVEHTEMVSVLPQTGKGVNSSKLPNNPLVLSIETFEVNIRL